MTATTTTTASERMAMPPPPPHPLQQAPRQQEHLHRKKLFVFGLGYTATRAAVEFHEAQGFDVAGTSRSAASAQEVAMAHATLFCAGHSDAQPRNVFVFDGTAWDDDANDGVSLQQALSGTTHMIISIPASRVMGQEDIVLSALGQPFLQAVAPTLEWLAYLSTIGVYGETHGIAVDESAPVGSTVARSQRRIAAERQWLATPLPCHIFRIAGIYGPGRGTLTKVRSGSATRIHLPGRLFNRIHVDDIVLILLASAAHPNAGAIYNVADDEPAPAQQVTAYACELLGLPVLPLQSWEEAEQSMSAMAKSFYAESKVVSNTKIRQELGVTLRYPTYREGLLAQLLEEEREQHVEPADGRAPWKRYQERLVVVANIGSLKPEPYLDLRQICFRLSRALRLPVVPCSFRFSNRIDASRLHGTPAMTLEMVLTQYLCQAKTSSMRDVVVLPLFFGNSTTLTEFLPTVLRKSLTRVQDQAAGEEASLGGDALTLSARVGRCLVDLDSPADDRIAQILHERVGFVMTDVAPTDVSVLVLEHGTPNREVHDATELVTRQLRDLMTPSGTTLVQHACMERREASEYDFNDPLLLNAVDHYEIKSKVVIVALLFFSQGRHAGAKGDIEEIVDEVKLRHPDLDIRVTEPLGTHGLLSEILQDRYRVATQLPTPQYTLP